MRTILDRYRTVVAVKPIELTAIFHSIETEEFWLEERRCTIEGNGTDLHYGDEIEVTVVPDNGFHFVGWSATKDRTGLAFPVALAVTVVEGYVADAGPAVLDDGVRCKLGHSVYGVRVSTKIPN